MVVIGFRYIHLHFVPYLCFSTFLFIIIYPWTILIVAISFLSMNFLIAKLCSTVYNALIVQRLSSVFFTVAMDEFSIYWNFVIIFNYIAITFSYNLKGEQPITYLWKTISVYRSLIFLDLTFKLFELGTWSYSHNSCPLENCLNYVRLRPPCPENANRFCLIFTNYDTIYSSTLYRTLLNSEYIKTDGRVWCIADPVLLRCLPYSIPAFHFYRIYAPNIEMFIFNLRLIHSIT